MYRELGQNIYKINARQIFGEVGIPTSHYPCDFILKDDVVIDLKEVPIIVKNLQGIFSPKKIRPIEGSKI